MKITLEIRWVFAEIGFQEGSKLVTSLQFLFFCCLRKLTIEKIQMKSPKTKEYPELRVAHDIPKNDT